MKLHWSSFADRWRRTHSRINSIRRTFGCACQLSSHGQLQLIRFIDAANVNEVSDQISATEREETKNVSMIEKDGKYLTLVKRPRF